jgi:hypothetical protein
LPLPLRLRRAEAFHPAAHRPGEGADSPAEIEWTAASRACVQVLLVYGRDHRVEAAETDEPGVQLREAVTGTLGVAHWVHGGDRTDGGCERDAAGGIK